MATVDEKLANIECIDSITIYPEEFTFDPFEVTKDEDLRLLEEINNAVKSHINEVNLLSLEVNLTAPSVEADDFLEITKDSLECSADRCYICGCAFNSNDINCGRAKTKDHIIPKILGGKDNNSNIAFACWTCNHLKGEISPSKALFKLIERVSRLETFVFEFNSCIDALNEYGKLFNCQNEQQHNDALKTLQILMDYAGIQYRNEDKYSIDMENLIEKVRQLEGKIKTYKANISAINSANSEHKQRIAQDRVTIDKYREQVKDLQAEIRILKKPKNISNVSIQEILDRLQSLESSHKKLASEVRTINKYNTQLTLY